MSAVETPPELPTGRQCPRCGAQMTDEQEWCLACGAAVGTRVVAAPGWRTPIVLAAGILALAAIAVAIAIVQLADDTGRITQNPPAASTPAPAATPAPATTATPEPTLPEASGQETPTATPSATAEPTTTPDAGAGATDIGRWPTGKAGWTVVLSSDPSRSTAEGKAEGFASEGIAGVGILDSDDFSSLRGGFWVVYAGEFETQAEATDALDGIDARQAYIREIDPN